MMDWQRHLIAEAGSCRAITFDIFGTLLFRNVPTAQDVFDLVGGNGFRYVRKLAETRARYINKTENLKLDDIYRFLPGRLPEDELKAEKYLSFPNSAVLEVCRILKKQGKKIYGISDTHLPTNFVEELLCSAGIEPDGIYISSEYGLVKASGNLFGKFLSETKHNACDVLYVGDSEGAKRVGIRSFCLPPKENRLLYSNANGKDVVLRSMINNGLQNIDDRLERIGYEVVGPLLVGYCQWIHAQKEIYQFEKLFFLARDMLLTLRIYRLLYGEQGTEYLYSSRESLSKPDKDALGQYLKRIGFSGNIAVVDTGWHGTSQPKLEHYAGISGLDCSVGGLYLGKHYGYRYLSRSEKSASCLQKGRSVSPRISVNEGFLEAMISAYEPKTVAYNVVDGVGCPVLRNDGESMGQIKRIQHGAVRFASEWDKSDIIDVNRAFRIFLHFAEDPYPEDVDALCRAESEDSANTLIVRMKNRKYYLHHPTEWKNDLNGSAWKGAVFHKTFRHMKPFYMAGILSYRIVIPLKERRNYKGKPLF